MARLGTLLTTIQPSGHLKTPGIPAFEVKTIYYMETDSGRVSLTSHIELYDLRQSNELRQMIESGLGVKSKIAQKMLGSCLHSGKEITF